MSRNKTITFYIYNYQFCTFSKNESTSRNIEISIKLDVEMIKNGLFWDFNVEKRRKFYKTRRWIVEMMKKIHPINFKEIYEKDNDGIVIINLFDFLLNQNSILEF